MPSIIRYPGSKAKLVAEIIASFPPEFHAAKHVRDEQIVAGIKAGEITPDMTRAEAAALRADPIEKPEREVCVLAWEALSGAYAKYADKLGEDDRLFVLERLESLVRLIRQEALPDASRGQGADRPEAATAAG